MIASTNEPVERIDVRDVDSGPFLNDGSELWELVTRQLRPLHEARACREYLETFQLLLGDAQGIPTHQAVSARLRGITGFQLERADGVVAPRAFFTKLAKRVFVSAASIRPAETPYFTPNPDWIHDLIGHAVLVAHPRGAELYQLFGRAYRPSMTDADVARLSSLFWYVAEAGVLFQDGQCKALGGALLSSLEELSAFRGARIRAFDPPLVADMPFDDSTCQCQLFGARSLLELHVRLQRHFGLSDV